MMDLPDRFGETMIATTSRTDVIRYWIVLFEAAPTATTAAVSLSETGAARRCGRF